MSWLMIVLLALTAFLILMPMPVKHNRLLDIALATKTQARLEALPQRVA